MQFPMRSLFFFSCALVVTGCTCTRVEPVVVPDAGACVCAPAVAAASVLPAQRCPARHEPSSEKPHVHPLAVCDA